MKEITEFESYTVEIWRRARQRHMHLRVRPDGTVRVTCNGRVAKRAVLAFVFESRDFIEKSLLELQRQKSRFPQKKYLSGEQHLLLGEPRLLTVVWSWAEKIQVRVTDDGLEMLAPLSSTADERKASLNQFARALGRRLLMTRIADWQGKMGLKPAAVSIRGQVTRWGSCSSRREISLNWKLIAAPSAVVDYVVIHELAHLQHMNHSAQFWALVARFCPDWKTAKSWLRQHEAEIAAQFGR
jgi:predicted metal-dependent hydrolase